MSDLISRQEAIDAVIKRDANCGIDSAEVLKLLPSVQPRKGKWVKTYRDGFGNLTGHCNKCGGRCLVDNFCPNCGADMREGDSDDD